MLLEKFGPHFGSAEFSILLRYLLHLTSLDRLRRVWLSFITSVTARVDVFVFSRLRGRHNRMFNVSKEDGKKKAFKESGRTQLDSHRILKSLACIWYLKLHSNKESSINYVIRPSSSSLSRLYDTPFLGVTSHLLQF